MNGRAAAMACSPRQRPDGTSYADRTSVLLRGKWVLENLLGSPPPPPPPNVHRR